MVVARLCLRPRGWTTTAGANTNLATSASQCGSGSGSTASITLGAASASNGIVLNWTTANLTTATQEVYRDTDANPSGRVRVATVSSAARSHTDTSAGTGVTYCYWIKNTTSGVVTNSNAASARR